MVAVGSALFVLALVAVAPADEPDSCGKPGKPACPLQKFMRERVAAPLAKRDLPALAEAFDRIGKLNPRPKKWGNWDAFAKKGAAAAREGNESRARQMCGRCHRVYRRQYNFQHRERPLAPAPD